MMFTSLAPTSAALLDQVTPLAPVPEGYELVNTTEVKTNRQPTTLFRYENTDNPGNGEHVSLVVQHDPVLLLGYLRMDRRYANPDLPSCEETTRIARDFFRRIDADWNDTLNNLWIHAHDETLLLDGREEVTVTGMKFKCYREPHDDFAWVIVGYDRKIIAFERDTKWQHVRLTEKWLHDSWRRVV